MKITTFNQALLGRWLWGFEVEQEQFCMPLLTQNMGALVYSGSERPHGCSVWKEIWAGWDRFSTLVSFEVGHGERIRILHDVWCGDQSLKVLYPDLYLIEAKKDDSVNSLITFREGNKIFCWNLTFLRKFPE